MIANQRNRLDPSLMDRNELEQLSAVIQKADHAALVSKDGEKIGIPEPIYRHLVRVVRMMKDGKAVVMLPENETFTTQAAADFLGMSRQYFVNLVEEGKIPFHHVGSHRRVYFKDLLNYQQKRDGERRDALDRLSDEIDEAGLYFADPAEDQGDNAG